MGLHPTAENEEDKNPLTFDDDDPPPDCYELDEETETEAALDVVAGMLHHSVQVPQFLEKLADTAKELAVAAAAYDAAQAPNDPVALGELAVAAAHSASPAVQKVATAVTKAARRLHRHMTDEEKADLHAILIERFENQREPVKRAMDCVRAVERRPVQAAGQPMRLGQHRPHAPRSRGGNRSRSRGKRSEAERLETCTKNPAMDPNFVSKSGRCLPKCPPGKIRELDRLRCHNPHGRRSSSSGSGRRRARPLTEEEYAAKLVACDQDGMDNHVLSASGDCMKLCPEGRERSTDWPTRRCHKEDAMPKPSLTAERRAARLEHCKTQADMDPDFVGASGNCLPRCPPGKVRTADRLRCHKPPLAAAEKAVAAAAQHSRKRAVADDPKGAHSGECDTRHSPGAKCNRNLRDEPLLAAAEKAVAAAAQQMEHAEDVPAVLAAGVVAAGAAAMAALTMITGPPPQQAQRGWRRKKSPQFLMEEQAHAKQIVEAAAVVALMASVAAGGVAATHHMEVAVVQAAAAVEAPPGSRVGAAAVEASADAAAAAAAAAPRALRPRRDAAPVAPLSPRRLRNRAPEKVVAFPPTAPRRSSRNKK